MTAVELAPTHRLHQQLIARFRSDPQTFLARCAEANRALSRQGVTFEKTRSMAVALSALVISDEAADRFRRIAETLHGLVEQALDWVSASPQRLKRHFADHQRMFPYLEKTPGLHTWQGFSRYDAVITPDGQVKIIELNTGCPAGFLHAESFSRLTRRAIDSLGLDLNSHLERFGTVAADVLIDELLRIEQKAGVEQGLVGLVNDENGLLNELELIAEAFRHRGREARIVGAEKLRHRDGRAFLEDLPVSLTFNKVRVSTPTSPGWNWKAGFEQRYAGLLSALGSRAMASVNNLGALTIGEDKGLLGLLLHDEFQRQLTAEQRDFIARHVLWTVRLQDGPVVRRGETIDLLRYVRRHREQFVIKPANEGRGFRVLIGRHCSQESWQAACRVDADLPCVVQDYAPLATLPVIDPRGEQPKIVEMFLTVGLAVIRGRYHGLVSRVSANPVNNVGLKGIVQAVLMTPP